MARKHAISFLRTSKLVMWTSPKPVRLARCRAVRAATRQRARTQLSTACQRRSRRKSIRKVEMAAASHVASAAAARMNKSTRSRCLAEHIKKARMDRAPQRTDVTGAVVVAFCRRRVTTCEKGAGWNRAPEMGKEYADALCRDEAGSTRLRLLMSAFNATCHRCLQSEQRRIVGRTAATVSAADQGGCALDDVARRRRWRHVLVRRRSPKGSMLEPKCLKTCSPA